MIKIGVIADDFTGATDIASFLVENGLSAVQMNGVPTGELPEDTDTVCYQPENTFLSSNRSHTAIA